MILDDKIRKMKRISNSKYEYKFQEINPNLLSSIFIINSINVNSKKQS